MAKIYICDYINPRTQKTESFVLECEGDGDEESVKNLAIEGLKTLNIPKRYLINVEEF